MNMENSSGAIPDPTQTANTITVTDSDAANFIDQRELLRRVPISLRTLRTWRTNGVIPELKINRRTLFHWPSVETALLNLQRKAK